MKSLLHKAETAASWPTLAMNTAARETGDDALAGEEPLPLAPSRWDWRGVRRVLVVRLRSIGDTVLATPALYALRRFVPGAQIDILLEDWVAPLLDGLELVDQVITIERHSKASRARVMRALRAARYDVVYNLHGGTTATLITRASGAKHRVGYASYQYSRLHNHTAPPASELWGRPQTHSVEQQLALLGWTGVPVSDRPATRLSVTREGAASLDQKLRALKSDQPRLDPARPFALMHPAAAFETKQWATLNFARVAESLAARGLQTVSVVAPNEAEVNAALNNASAAPIVTLSDLSLPSVTALAARARLFVGNDSGIAHIAAAVGTPSVVIFGSSNVAHWRPWTGETVPAEVVREELSCQPCPGYTCAEFDAPECIRRVSVERVMEAIERVLKSSDE
ncbi:MAG TPA: glycosyltransferase family 9 protein [Pyrinomonadaceae bacterium]|jgi:lipopolysaccharide heptosyltransferase II|nr:glycosyltransferase family 9 protein [Pyrinomonadaceae bacterium]